MGIKEYLRKQRIYGSDLANNIIIKVNYCRAKIEDDGCCFGIRKSRSAVNILNLYF
jgi:hypothetical protein